MQTIPLILFVLFLTLIPGPGRAQASRQKIDLAGSWEIRPDPKGQGLPAGWFRPGAAGKWLPIVVPSTWEMVLGQDFDTVAWYRKSFVLPAIVGPGRVLLRFHGAATAARVWVNGKEVGAHLGAWTPFTFDITTLVKPGAELNIAVRLDEKVGHNTQGFLPIIAPHFGGLWQGVEVILTAGPAWIDDQRLGIDASRIAPGGKVASLGVEVPLRGTLEPGAKVRFSGFETVGATPLVVRRWEGQSLEASKGYWPGGAPDFRNLVVTLLGPDGVEWDRVSLPYLYRKVEADGPRLLLNGKPIIIRGVLTWGCYPPGLAPAPTVAAFRKQAIYLRDCGFNLIKFCLWLPPSRYLRVLDELGMYAWIEYPTWHAKFDQAHQQELLHEYVEMSAHDRNHPCVILRSITCETGPSADLDILKEIYRLLKQRIPGTLVEDDSSWIGWNRVHDFWDDHTYWNNFSWRQKLRSLADYRQKRTMKPLLLGEAISADTYVDSRPFRAMDSKPYPWWTPRWLQDQLRFEQGLRARYGKGGFDPVADLLLTSRKYAMAMRRWQVEAFREELPHAGYVISVIRNVRLCAMGLFDDWDQPKWSVKDWSWHGRDSKGALPDCRGRQGNVASPRRRLEAGREFWDLPAPADLPDGYVIYGKPEGGDGGAIFPGARQLAVGKAIDVKVPLVVTWALRRPVLEYLQAGGRVLHLTGSGVGSWKTDRLWFLRGTVWSPPTPGDFFQGVPREMLPYLQNFELAREGVMRGDLLWEQVDPLLAFIETHDLTRVRTNLLLFLTGVGKGRLAVSCLRHGGGRQKNYSGFWLARQIAAYLVSGPPPTRSLAGETKLALATALTGETQKVTGEWRFRKDENNQGLTAGWQKPECDDSRWERFAARSGKEGKIWNGYDGWGWYRRKLTVPATCKGSRIRLVFGSVDDMYELYVNGKLAGGYGKQDRSTSSYLKRTWVDVSEFLIPGQENTIAVRVYDWVGSGGLNGPVRMTTGPVEEGLDLLRR